MFSLCHQNDEGSGCLLECRMQHWQSDKAHLKATICSLGQLKHRGEIGRKIASFHFVKNVLYYDLLQVLSVINANWAHHFFFCRKIPRLILNTSVLFCPSQIWFTEEESLPGVDRFNPILHDAKGWYSRLPIYSWVKVLSSQDWSRTKLAQHHMNQPPQECHVTHR